MKIPGLHIALLFAVATVALWAYMNQPEAEPEWPHRVQGFSFNPYQADQDAMKNEYPTREQIAHDLDVLKGKTSAVRTYDVEGTIALVPELAEERGINVTMGIWLDHRLEH